MFIVQTKIICNFVCAICKHPEKDSFRAACGLASFIHPRCNEYTSGPNILNEDITCNRQVLPVVYQQCVVMIDRNLAQFQTVRIVVLKINTT